MKIKLDATEMLSPPQVKELAMQAHELHQRATKAIDRLRKDEETQRARIAAFWKDRRVSRAEGERLAKEELAEKLFQIRDNAGPELDGLVKAALELMSRGAAQRPFYESPLQLLDRAALGEPRRTDYAVQLRDVGPIALARYAQVAVGTRNLALAAAVSTHLDRVPSSERPLSGGDLARAVMGEEWELLDQALKVVQHRCQSTVNVVRAFRVVRGGALPPSLGDAIARSTENPELVDRILSDGEEEDGKTGKDEAVPVESLGKALQRIARKR